MGLIEWIIAVSILSSTATLVARGKDFVIARALLITALVFSSLYVFSLMERYRGTARRASMSSEMKVYGFKIEEEKGRALMLCSVNDSNYPIYIDVDLTDGIQRALAKGRAIGKGEPFLIEFGTVDEGSENGSSGPVGDAAGDDRVIGQSLESARNIRVTLPSPVLPKKE